MMKNCLFIIALLVVVQVKCQVYTLSGKVTDKETGNPIAGASVFLSSTSIGTSANDKGLFALHNVPTGKFDLVVSSLGYETYFETITPASLKAPLNITLKSKANQLADVVVGTYEKNGWATWGKTFTDDFIGTSFNAANCEIKNYDIIKFRYSKTKRRLEAFADEPLVIENRGLGYTIHYKLEMFLHDFENSTITYYGFPLFEEMSGNFRKQKRWQENRKDAYFGSVMHFMRCMYANRLNENGYEIKRMERIENTEKKRVQKLYKYMAGADGNVNFEETLPKDSLDYYNKVLRQPNATNILHNQVLPGDSIAYAEDSVTAVLSFKDYLQITYTRKKTPYDYSRVNVSGVTLGNNENLPNSAGAEHITSFATLINNRPLYVSYNGAYYAPQDMLTLGYWAYSEKLCALLPFDYWPPQQQ